MAATVAVGVAAPVQAAETVPVQWNRDGTTKFSNVKVSIVQDEVADRGEFPAGTAVLDVDFAVEHTWLPQDCLEVGANNDGWAAGACGYSYYLASYTKRKKKPARYKALPVFIYNPVRGWFQFPMIFAGDGSFLSSADTRNGDIATPTASYHRFKVKPGQKVAVCSKAYGYESVWQGDDGNQYASPTPDLTSASVTCSKPVKVSVS